LDGHDIINFWFTEIQPAQRFKKDPAFDRLCTERFSGIHLRACACELHRWRETAPGALAEIIVLDQFSRNIFRDRPQAFAADSLALALAQEMVSRGQDRELPPEQRAFVYMPYMHSESRKIHELAVDLFQQPGLEDNYRFELKHKEIIDRFGRYPHRNEILGRQSTREELEFLQQPGSRF
jgi:uncharacterized protein (DUF924 family)